MPGDPKAITIEIIEFWTAKFCWMTKVSLDSASICDPKACLLVMFPSTVNVQRLPAIWLRLTWCLP
jgi:hypothetical protein